jgi:hypothetical protein
MTSTDHTIALQTEHRILLIRPQKVMLDFVRLRQMLTVLAKGKSLKRQARAKR